MEQRLLKQQLPHPYNQDLSDILLHLDRRKQESRARLANDPVTAAYLAAAMRLVQRQLGPGAERLQTDPDDEDSIERPLLAFLSNRAVAEEVQNNPQPFPSVGNVATLRSTWQSHADFIADLLNFGLWSAQYPATRENDVRDKNAKRLLAGDDPVQAVHDLAYWESSTIIDLPTFRLKVVASACADGDRSLAEAMAESTYGFIKPWKELYLEFLQARGMQLRAGITIDDFANILQISSSGVAVRMISDPASKIVDHDRRHSLLGTIALALIYACLEPINGATGLTLEQAVDAQLDHSARANTVSQSGT
jgi:hypothetical protein